VDLVFYMDLTAISKIRFLVESLIIVIFTNFLMTVITNRGAGRCVTIYANNGVITFLGVV